MAKTIKKAAKANVVKSIDELKLELVTKQNDLIGSRRGNKLGELTNTRVIRTVRKEIARLHTAIRANELEQKAKKGEN
jgi:ribosomal protein L29